MRIIRKHIILLAGLCLLLSNRPGLAEAGAVPEARDIRVAQYEGLTRFVLEVEKRVSHKTFFLKSPPRFVIDLAPLDWQLSERKLRITGSPLVKRVRYGVPKPGVSRVVLDLKKNAALVRSFVLPPEGGNAVRIVFDIAPEGMQTSYTELPKAPPAEVSGGMKSREPPRPPIVAFRPVPVVKPERHLQRLITPTIIIDPGHGGVDPGAIGHSGTREKDITFAFSKKLRDALKKTGRYQVYMTRDSDTFVKLRERIRRARINRGDLFISLHADSTPTAEARGLSVYTLSETASDKEAALLAKKENKADIIAGVDLSTENEDIAEILIDLAQRETINKSSEFAEILMGELSQDVRMLQNTHRFAGFAVLKAPDIPSVLVELGFLSNKTDERLLKTRDFQNKVVRGIIRGVDSFFEQYPKRQFEE